MGISMSERANTIERVRGCLEHLGSATRNEIMDATGMTKDTVTQALWFLRRTDSHVTATSRGYTWNEDGTSFDTGMKEETEKRLNDVYCYLIHNKSVCREKMSEELNIPVNSLAKYMKYLMTMDNRVTIDNAHGGGYEYLEVDEPPRIERRRAKVLDLFRDGALLHIADVVRLTGFSRHTSGSYLSCLVERGDLVKTRNRSFVLNEDPRYADMFDVQVRMFRYLRDNKYATREQLVNIIGSKDSSQTYMYIREMLKLCKEIQVHVRGKHGSYVFKEK